MNQQTQNGRNVPHLVSKLHRPLATLGKNYKSITTIQSEPTACKQLQIRTNVTLEKVASFRSKNNYSLEEKHRCDSGERTRKHNARNHNMTSSNKDQGGSASGISKEKIAPPKTELQKVIISRRLTNTHNSSVSANEARTASLREETDENKPNSISSKSLIKTLSLNDRGTGDVVSLSDDMTSVCLSNGSASDKVVKPVQSVIRNIRHQEHSRYNKGLYPLKASLFPDIPPYLNFTFSTEKMIKLPKEIRNVLQWKLSKVTPSLIIRIVRRSGFRIVKDENIWTSTWGRHVGFRRYNDFKENQKVNHFPGTFHLGRKDRLWMNIVKMQEMNGKKNFSFMPQTFVLPRNMNELREAWLEAEGKTKWIIKPPASARGYGINVVHQWSDVPKTESVIVQKYINRPYLINETKFDLRLYILVTSFDPLRLYVYEDGLVRFASEKYSRSFKRLDEKYIHLTNYSINRCNACYISNEDENLRQGHKWTLKCLWSYFRENGINDRKVWSSLVDVVIKTVISCESPISKLVKTYAKNRYSYYELFGFDIILDYKLKPWLLEVNISPSLHTNSQLDLKIKGELIKDMLNIAGIHITKEIELDLSSKLQISKIIGIDPESKLFWNDSLYQLDLCEEDRTKQEKFKDNRWSQSSILRNLTPTDVRQLVQSEDELARRGRFVRVFPTRTSSSYLEYFESPKYYNLLLDAWEKRYYNIRTTGIRYLRYLCKMGVHLRTSKIVHHNAKSDENNEESSIQNDKNELTSSDNDKSKPSVEENNAIKSHGDGPSPNPTLISESSLSRNEKEIPIPEAQTSSTCLQIE